VEEPGLVENPREIGQVSFDHHDAGEDARAAAEVVPQAEEEKGLKICFHDA
jgi:hypothetical protein